MFKRKAFYLYDQALQGIEIGISFNTQAISNLKPENIEIVFGQVELSEEIKTWDDLFDSKKVVTINKNDIIKAFSCL